MSSIGNLFSYLITQGVSRLTASQRNAGATGVLAATASGVVVLPSGGQISKSHVGLSNVDNTSDASKPVSAETAAALARKADLLGANFTGFVFAPQFEARGSEPTVQWVDTNGHTNQKYIRLVYDSGVFRLQKVNDAYSLVVAEPITIASDQSVHFAGQVNTPRATSATGFAVGGDTSDFPSTSGSIPNYGVGAPGAAIVTLAGFGGLRFYTSQLERLNIAGDGSAAFRNSTGFGYGAGSGGTVTQATSKGTSVTLNKPCGQITMHNGALAAGASAFFQVSTTAVNQSDGVLLTPIFGPPGWDNYTLRLVHVGNGGFGISVTNVSGSTLSDALVLTFEIIKGSTS